MPIERPKIVYNVAYGKRALMTALTFRNLGHHLKDARFDGISALPLRQAVDADVYKKYFPDVQLVEDAWNPGENDPITLAVGEGLVGLLRRRRGDMTEPPLPQDTLLFPGRLTSRHIVNQLMDQPNRYFIAAHFENARFPGRSHVHSQSDFRPHVMTLDEVLHRAEDLGIQLWYDPKRLVESQSVSFPGNPTHNHRNAALSEIQRLGMQLAGVDIGSRVESDMADLIAGKGFFAELAEIISELNISTARVEIIAPFRALLPVGAQESTYLKDIVQALREIVRG